MTPREVRVEFCSLGGKVGAYFKHQYAHDCFCNLEQADEAHFQYESTILKFINDAVDEKITRDGNPKDRWNDL